MTVLGVIDVEITNGVASISWTACPAPSHLIKADPNINGGKVR